MAGVLKFIKMVKDMKVNRKVGKRFLDVKCGQLDQAILGNLKTIR
jgi:hypothetical protein